MNADIGAALLTITSMRARSVDFTQPFLSGGITTLSKKTVVRQNTNFFFFLQPFKANVWILIVISYLVVGISVSCYEKWLYPVGDENNRERLDRQNSTIFMKGFWWTFQTFSWQGSARAPKSYPGRILSVFWLFLVMCILSIYIASLVNLLPDVKNHHETPIQSAKDLVEQTQIKYGTTASTSTQALFRTSKIAIYEQMWNVMASSYPSVFVRSNDEGVRRVLEGNYVFLVESLAMASSAMYYCDLQLGKPFEGFGSKGYELLTQKGSSLGQALNLAVLHMREDGVLDRLYSKWLQRNMSSTICERSSSGTERQPGIKRDSVGMNDVAGPFIILLCGCIVSLVVAIILLCQRKSCPPQKRCSTESAENETAEPQKAASPI